MKNKAKVLLALLLITLISGTAIFAEDKTVSVRLPKSDVSINNEIIDNQNSKYPVIVYDEITYFPMTWNYGKALGLNIEWNNRSGVKVSKSENIETLVQETGEANDLDKEYKATIIETAVETNGRRVNNKTQQYPVLLFRDVTYVPITWEFAVSDFGLQYTWSEEEGLSIAHMSYKMEKNSINRERARKGRKGNTSEQTTAIDNNRPAWQNGTSAFTRPSGNMTGGPGGGTFTRPEGGMTGGPGGGTFTRPEGGMTEGPGGMSGGSPTDSEGSAVTTYYGDEDLLTPGYYTEGSDSEFVATVNKFLEYARKETFNHPLENKQGEVPEHSVPSTGTYGAGKGPGGTGEHHPALDMHVGDNEMKVDMFAAHDGYVSIDFDAEKYRHVLTITKEVNDDDGNVLGKMVTLYGHIELDLDKEDGLSLDGTHVNKGDLVTQNLYKGTTGGAHLHFETRYYRPGDSGTEEFMGSVNSGDTTEPSAGVWSYGYWNPDVGYGFANHSNHGMDN